MNKKDRQNEYLGIFSIIIIVILAAGMIYYFYAHEPNKEANIPVEATPPQTQSDKT